MRIASIVGVLALAACAKPEPLPPVALMPIHTQAIEDGVRRSLKDPDSGKISNVRAARMNDGQIRVCGTVNAKNSYGGYTGGVPFIGHMTNTEPPMFAVAVMGNPAKKDGPIIEMMCSNV